MIWRVFKRSQRGTRDEAWWRQAEDAAEAATAERVLHLRNMMSAAAPLDESELQEEMLDGLEQLVELGGLDALPVLETQHRVIGTDPCHLAIPATLAGDVDVPGKLFLTARRVVFAGGRAQSWPFHRLREIIRAGRTVTLVANGPADAARLLCNSFGDALRVQYIARRLAAGTRRPTAPTRA